jgi:RimJ/RimL family protein N-acetyltransferase
MQWPPAPIATQRLTLREARSVDESLFVRLFTDERVRAHLGGPVPSTELTERVADVPWRGVFTVMENSSSHAIGLVHIGPYRTGEIELSYELLPECWGQGFAREACLPVLRWAQREVTDGAPIIAVTRAANTRSLALLSALGMVERERFLEFGAPQVLMVWFGEDAVTAR